MLVSDDARCELMRLIRTLLCSILNIEFLFLDSCDSISANPAMYLEFTLMPTYQYICNECEHAFEAVQAFSDEPLTTCPECGKSIRKIYSNVGIVFKGSGFYKTDSQKTTNPAPTSAPASTPATPTKSE